MEKEFNLTKEKKITGTEAMTQAINLVKQAQKAFS